MWHTGSDDASSFLRLKCRLARTVELPQDADETVSDIDREEEEESGTVELLEWSRCGKWLAAAVKKTELIVMETENNGGKPR